MRLLDRYLLRELLVPLGYCLGGFLVFWIAFDLFTRLDDLRDAHLGLLAVAQYYLLITPEFLGVVLPVALLLALLYTLTHLARHHETTAMRAAGISLWRISVPYLAVGVLCSGVLFVVNEVWVPRTADQAERIRKGQLNGSDAAVADVEINLGFVNAAAGRTWQIGAYHWRTAEMTRPQVGWTLADGTVRWIFAERGVRSNGVWHFLNVREFRGEAGTNSLLVPLRTASSVAFPEFTETPEQIRSEVRINQGFAIRKAKKADVPLAVLYDYLRLHPQPDAKQDAWLRTKLHGRLAAPWTCLVVVLVALPFGAMTGRRNVFVGVASSIVIVFVFFLMSQLGLALGVGRYVPPWFGAWFPNVAFAAFGLWLTRRVR